MHRCTRSASQVQRHTCRNARIGGQGSQSRRAKLRTQNHVGSWSGPLSCLRSSWCTCSMDSARNTFWRGTYWCEALRNCKSSTAAKCTKKISPPILSPKQFGKRLKLVTCREQLLSQVNESSEELQKFTDQLQIRNTCLEHSGTYHDLQSLCCWPASTVISIDCCFARMFRNSWPCPVSLSPSCSSPHNSPAGMPAKISANDIRTSWVSGFLMSFVIVKTVPA